MHAIYNCYKLVLSIFFVSIWDVLSPVLSLVLALMLIYLNWLCNLQLVCHFHGIIIACGQIYDLRYANNAIIWINIAAVTLFPVRLVSVFGLSPENSWFISHLALLCWKKEVWSLHDNVTYVTEDWISIVILLHVFDWL